MKKLLFASLFLVLISAASAQQVVDLNEGTPYVYNGLEYGFYVTNETSKEVKGEDFQRYEINLYVSNKNGCLKLIPFRNDWNAGTDEAVTVAEFNCTNATGKRMTAKKGNVGAKAFYANVRVRDEITKDKYRTIWAQVGYAILNGQTVTTKITVIVPKGERPKMNCRLINLPDVQN
jgi:opacity protein-like surface antigen